MMIRVYGFDECPYCRSAIDDLLFEDCVLDVVKIPTLDERKAFMDERGFVAPNRTFPRVYEVVDDQEVLIGGYSDLQTFLGHSKAA